MRHHKIVTMKLAELEPATYNPRAISHDAMVGLRASLGRFGVVQPLVWNKTTGRIVGGHQRHRALLDSGEVEAQVVVVEMGEEDERELNVALNNPHIAGHFTDDLQDLLDEILAADPAGFHELRLDELVTSLPASEPEIEEWSAESIQMPDGLIVYLPVPHAEREAVEGMLRAKYPEAEVKCHLDFSGDS